MAAESREIQRRESPEEVLQNIRESEDVAAWYRVLSRDQVLAISKLTDALRDDWEQDSTYRVHTCLSTLGINPLIKRRHLKKLIFISRGNDLAFLYFLWTGFYRCNQTVYTYNEQVLMSSIMHLDLHMTLLQLDVILPPGHLSSANQARLRKKNLLKAQVTQSPSAPKVCQKSKNILPYFWRQPRPKQLGKKFTNKTSRQRDIVVNFPFWPVGEKPNYQVSKVNRWFATHQLSPIRCMVYRMIKDIIIDYWKKSSDSQPLREIDKKNLCDSHREKLKQEQLIKDELIFKAHNHFLQLIDVSAKQNEQRKKRIIGQLNKDIEECMQQRRKLKITQYTDVMLLNDKNSCLCGRVKTTPQNSKLKCMIGMDDYNPIAHLKTTATSEVLDITDKDTVNRWKCSQVPDSEEQCTQFYNSEDEKKRECPVHLSSPRKKKCIGKCRRSLTLNSNNYFQSSQLHKPYVFNYHQTFHQCSASLEPIQVIHRQALDALKCHANITQSSINVSKHKICICIDPTECTKESVVQAIVECAEEMCQNSMKSLRKLWSIPSRKEVTLKTNPCLEIEDLKCNSQSSNHNYFDPNDSKLMEAMLRDGMKILRKDPRFVFASFPDSHKTILMREWIKRRYGKTYTQNEIEKTMKNSGIAFKAVINLQREAPFADLSVFRNEKTNYINRSKIDKKAKELINKYNRDLNEKLMQHTAFCWSFMGSQFWKRAYCTKNFYAYLPARNVDILRVRPWTNTKISKNSKKI